MPTPTETLTDLEHRFWQSMVDQDTEAALQMLNDPAVMVSSHGALKFDHDGYRRMAEHGSTVLTSFYLSDLDVVFPNETTAILAYRVRQTVAARGKPDRVFQEMADTSTWILANRRWQCVMHTETPVDAPASRGAAAANH
jgi:hypothetical protein